MVRLVVIGLDLEVTAIALPLECSLESPMRPDILSELIGNNPQEEEYKITPLRPIVHRFVSSTARRQRWHSSFGVLSSGAGGISGVPSHVLIRVVPLKSAMWMIVVFIVLPPEYTRAPRLRAHSRYTRRRCQMDVRNRVRQDSRHTSSCDEASVRPRLLPELSPTRAMTGHGDERSAMNFLTNASEERRKPHSIVTFLMWTDKPYSDGISLASSIVS